MARHQEVPEAGREGSRLYPDGTEPENGLVFGGDVAADGGLGLRPQ